MPGSYYLVLIWTKHCKTIVSPQKNENFYFCTRRKQLHFSVLFRKNQNIFYVGVLNDCSKPSLGGQVAAICFPAVWWKFCRWIWCRWAVRCASNLTGHKLCTLALPSHFSGFMGDKVRHVADGVSLPAFLSGRQNQCWKMSTRSRNSEFWINLGSVSYSPDTSCQPWYGTHATIGRILRRCKQIIAPCLKYAVVLKRIWW